MRLAGGHLSVLGAVLSKGETGRYWRSWLALSLRDSFIQFLVGFPLGGLGGSFPNYWAVT